MNLLFRRVAIVLTVIGVLVTIGLAAYLVWLRLEFFFSMTQYRGKSSGAGAGLIMFAEKLMVAKIQNFTRLLLIASVVEIALFWLLVLLDIISQRHSLIATLVLVILVGIVVLIASTVWSFF
jgi:hypothetical protein